MQRHTAFQRMIPLLAAALIVIVLPTLGYAQDEDPSTRITEVVWSPNGEKVATSYRDGRIEVTSVDGQQESLILHADTSRVFALAWSPDSQYLASGSTTPNNALRIWDISTGNQIFETSRFGLDILAVAWSPDGRYVIATTAEPFNTRQKDIVVDTTTWEVTPFSVPTITSIAWSPDGSQIAFAATHSLAVHDASTLERLLSYSFDTDFSRPGFLSQLLKVIWSPDGSYLAGGTGDGRVVVWRVGTPEPLFTFEGNMYLGDDSALSWVNALYFDASGQSLTSVSGNGVVRTWNLADGSLGDAQLITPNYAAEFSPYGGRLAVGLVSPTEMSSVQPQTLIGSETIANGAVQIIVPDPSPERLQAIAAQCGAPLTVERGLDASIAAADYADVIAQIDALPAGTIPPACAADLRAVAAAMQGQ